MVYLAMTGATMRHAMASQKRCSLQKTRFGVRSMAPRSVLMQSGKVADMSTVPVKDKKGVFVGPEMYQDMNVLW